MLPALLVLGSLGGVAAIMAGLLAYLAPADEDGLYGPSVPRAVSTVIEGDGTAPSEGTAPRDDRTASGGEPAMALSPSVGPGGADTPLTAAAPTAPPPPPVVKPPAPLKGAGVRPGKLAIPKIDLVAPLIPLGVDAKREIETPPLSRPEQAGWYEHGPVPGQRGPSVVLGHVSTRRGPAVFNRLGEVRRGDKIKVFRSDGVVAEFTVDGVEQVSKKAFPSKRVYGNTGEAVLRLITCGGGYDRGTHHYTDNIIVYATLSKTGRA